MLIHSYTGSTFIDLWLRKQLLSGLCHADLFLTFLKRLSQFVKKKKKGSQLLLSPTLVNMYVLKNVIAITLQLV